MASGTEGPLSDVFKAVTARVEKTPRRNQDAIAAEYERSEKDRQINNRLDAWHRERGKRYEGCRLSNFQHNKNRDGRWKAVLDLTAYCDSLSDNIASGIGIVLFGASGTGKDHLASAVGRAAVVAGYGVTWANGVDFFADLRDAMKRDAPESSVIGSLALPDLLILSDPLPPKGAATDYQNASLFRVIDKRYNNCRPTIVTVNCANRSEAEERLGPQVIDRLSHDSLVIHCDWPSYRKPKP